MPVLQARSDVELVAVCAHTQKSLTRVQNRFGFEYTTTDYRELLAQPLDAVVITTPHGLHYEHAKAALQANCHVMVEKPMALRAREAWDLVETAEQHGLHLMVPYGWHYKPMVLAAKEQMERGAVGQVEYVLCHMASALRALYSGQPWPYTMEQAPDPGFNTYGDPELAGGGQGYAQLSHSIALLLWLTGLCAREVFAYMSGPGSQVELYDAIATKFNAGVIGVISGAGTLPPEKPKHQVDIRIFGSEGVFLLDLERERLEVQRNDGQHYKAELDEGAGGYACDGPPNRFIDLITGVQHENLSPGEIGARAIELLDAAYRSAVSGQAEAV
jgi:predicted dehydrogenase